MDGVVDFLPSPLDLPPVEGVNPKTGQEEEREPKVEAPFCALAFKVQTDPHVGKITYLRVYSGKISAGTTVYNATAASSERIGRLLLCMLIKEEIREAYAEIVAAIGLEKTTTGDTLCQQNAPFFWKNFFSRTGNFFGGGTPSRADQEKLAKL